MNAMPKLFPDPPRREDSLPRAEGGLLLPATGPDARQPGSFRRFMPILLAGVCALTYFTRGIWMERLFGIRPALKLEAIEKEGRLQILWNRAAMARRDVEGGVLEIVDGPSEVVIALDPPKIKAGSVQYVRRSERVDIHLSVQIKGRQRWEEFTGFSGPLPADAADPESLARRKQLEDAAATLERVRDGLEQEKSRAEELERSLSQIVEEQQRRAARNRAQTQMPPPTAGEDREQAAGVNPP